MNTQRTDHRSTVRRLSTVLLFGAILSLMIPTGAWAVGTASGTSISNQATITYNVGSVAQTPVDSDSDAGASGAQTTVFVVDNLVDLTVSTLDGAPVTVSPGFTAQVIRFRIDNEGNTVQDVLLSAVGQANGTNAVATPFGNLDDNFDADTSTNPIRIFVDSDGQSPTLGYTPSTWDGVGSETEVGFIDELAADNSITVYIVIDVSLSQTDGQIAIYGMLAQVAQGGAAAFQGTAIATDDGGSADTAGVDIVFGDAVGADDPVQTGPDGYHSSRSAYLVGTATLTVSKSSAVLEDPINGVSANAKAIPLARVQYSITITNGGSAPADNIVVTDAIPANTWFHSATAVTGGSATYSNDGGTSYTYSPSAGTYGEDANVDAVRVNVGTIPAGGNATVTFSVIIQ